MAIQPNFPLPLTQLSEEESLFYASVRQFAQDVIAPQVRTMDEKQQLGEGLVAGIFDLGLMGIEIPQTMGGAGGSFFDAVLAHKAFSQRGGFPGESGFSRDDL